MIWIAVDAMGGDFAPRQIVDGALAAARHFNLGVLLVGLSDLVGAELARHGDVDRGRVRVVEAVDVIAMTDAPAAGLRRRPGASIAVAAKFVAGGEAAALFSAGHTGATVMAAHGAFGMLPGVDRPALAVTIPTRRDAAVLLDVGATLECRPHHLLQFAVMGSVYARASLGLLSPRFELLSIGEEETKGNELARELARRLLKASSLGFIGNVEARDTYGGYADVIVCDGFTGNVALKISEGLVDTMEALLRKELSSTFAVRVRSLLTRRALRYFRRRVDYSEYGWAPMLGVAGVAIVDHGRSSALAVRNGVAMAYRFAADRFIEWVEGDIACATVSG